jgi:hypothetical protein
LHLPAEQIANHGGSAAIRHVDKVDTGHHLEQFTQDMLPAPDAGRPHVELTWIGLRESNELGDCPNRDRWIYINNMGGAIDACHRRDVTDEIEIELVVNGGIHG